MNLHVLNTVWNSAGLTLLLPNPDSDQGKGFMGNRAASSPLIEKNKKFVSQEKYRQHT